MKRHFLDHGKKDASQKKIDHFLLEQQLPDAKVIANTTADGEQNKAGDSVVVVKPVDHVTQVALETCRCTHLQEFLPHILDLDLCKAVHHPRGWVVANPVHSMHLSSQLEDSTPSANHWKQPPILYGEEQQRTNALHTEGIVEYWCPLDGYSALIHDDTALDKMEHLPTLNNVHKASTPVPAKQHPSPSHSSSGPLTSPSKVKSLPPAASSCASSPRVLQFGTSAKAEQVKVSSILPLKASSSSPSKASGGSKKKSAKPSPSKNRSPIKKDITTKPDTAKSATDTNTGNNMKKDDDKNKAKLKQRAEPVNSASISTPNFFDKAKDGTRHSKNNSSGAPVDKVTSSSSAVTAAVGSSSSPPSQFELLDSQYQHLRMEEDRIRLIRQSLSSFRPGKKKVDSKKKRKREASDFYKTSGLPGWRASAPKELSDEQEKLWQEAMVEARTKVEGWIERFRLCRESYWDEVTPQKDRPGSFYVPLDPSVRMRCCQTCHDGNGGSTPFWEGKKKTNRNKPTRLFTGDDLMQCLECSYIGCSPSSLAPDSKQHILQHLLMSGHKFAVTCGPRAHLFCFQCGDFVYHEVFDQEKQRIDFTKQLTYMSWKEHSVQRSFDPLHFIKTQDHGIVWRGLVATYPSLVPKDHIAAAVSSSRRQALFSGRIRENWLLTKPLSLSFAGSQCLLGDTERFRIAAPVGMYNLGNTCFKSSILQCLIHCKPLQKYFLKDMCHHHLSCQLYRKRELLKKKKKKKKLDDSQGNGKGESVCLACEMDLLFLSYYGSNIGKDVVTAIQESSSSLVTGKSDDLEYEANELERGDPLVISDMLISSWKSGGMDHLAGYAQRDAHEFLNSFLELMGKHTRQYRERIMQTINTVRDDNAVVPIADKNENDISKQLFQGTLRSVLVCEECGGKRMLQEPFMNISLTLSEEVERLQSASDPSEKQLSVETCLEHFIVAEKLGDPVQCPSCMKKTSTKKQHTFSRLPKILCLHLKRFDAARNRKIEDFVSFPARGLNMGTLLSHWCEVTSLPSGDPKQPFVEPRILYDLFGTVIHKGNMQSGHYLTNVKVDDKWYHCNDAHVSPAGVGDGEEAVLKMEGTYVLFYIRR